MEDKIIGRGFVLGREWKTFSLFVLFCFVPLFSDVEMTQCEEEDGRRQDIETETQTDVLSAARSGRKWRRARPLKQTQMTEEDDDDDEDARKMEEKSFSFDDNGFVKSLNWSHSHTFLFECSWMAAEH